MTKVELFNPIGGSRLNRHFSYNRNALIRVSHVSRLSRALVFLFVLSLQGNHLFAQGQPYTSYLVGNQNDVVTNPAGGVCLMGGATEDDNAMKWFLQRANGGDVLVLRATGANGYNTYLYSDLGIPVNSVETIVCNNAQAGSDPYVVQRIQQAEAIWFAGGDQWTYISYWRNTPVEAAINQSIVQRNIVLGGTSAGMAIQGKYYFSAQNGTITTPAALANPYNVNATVDSTSFLENSYLSNTITDTHFDNPDRKGRLVSFLARIATDYGVFANAIACDEYTAVCIDTAGIARVFGGFPNYDDVAFFVQSNCELTDRSPENCTPGTSLDWNLNGLAIKVYRILGDSSGSGTFDLNTWQAGSGGDWLNWYVDNGSFFEQIGSPINCLPLSVSQSDNSPAWELFPNPTANQLSIRSPMLGNEEQDLCLLNTLGQTVYRTRVFSRETVTLDLSSFNSGLYLIQIQSENRILYGGRIVKQ